MNRAESIMKWAIAVVIIFGLLTTFFILNWTTVLKISLIIISIALIGNILLQSGRGGGLAAIGGLTDQSMMGTKAGTFLGNVTYLIGVAFFITVIFLSKTNFTTKFQTELPLKEVSAPVPTHNHSHDQNNSGAETKTEEAPVGMSEVESSVGMKEVNKIDSENNSVEKTEELDTNTDK